MKDNDSFWKCAKIMIFYGLTQILKLFIATLVPYHSDPSLVTSILIFDLPGALIDLVVVFFIVQHSSRSEFNVLTAGMGWSVAMLLSSKYVPIWVGTRGLEFEWRYLCLSFQANLELVLTFVLFHTLWLLLRKNSSPAYIILGSILIALSSMSQTLFRLIEDNSVSVVREVFTKTAVSLGSALGTIVLRTMILAQAAEGKRKQTTSPWNDAYKLVGSTWKRYTTEMNGHSRTRDSKLNGYIGTAKR